MEEYVKREEYEKLINRLEKLERKVESTDGKYDELRVSLKEVGDKLDKYTENSERRIRELEDDRLIKNKDMEMFKDSFNKIAEQLKDMGDKITELNVAPIKKSSGRWDSLISCILTAVVTGIVTFILVKLGLK